MFHHTNTIYYFNCKTKEWKMYMCIRSVEREFSNIPSVVLGDFLHTVQDRVHYVMKVDRFIDYVVEKEKVGTRVRLMKRDLSEYLPVVCPVLEGVCKLLFSKGMKQLFLFSDAYFEEAKSYVGSIEGPENEGDIISWKILDKEMAIPGAGVTGQNVARQILSRATKSDVRFCRARHILVLLKVSHDASLCRTREVLTSNQQQQQH